MLSSNRFTPCFFFYLMTTIPCIWLLELKKSDSFLDDEEDNIVVNVSSQRKPTDPDFGVDINPGTWTVLIEELLLYLLILSRWMLPRGRVSREQLSELLFAFIGIASDIMEMFSLFGLEDVRKNRTLSYLVLSCWTISILQLCMTVTVTHEPRRGKNIKMIDDNDYEKEKPKIWSQILAIFCSMLMQDIPFVTLRLYTIITYNVINYSLIFFTSKNILVILLLLYKIAVLIQKRYYPEFLTEKEDEEKQIYDDDTDKKKDGRFLHIQQDFSDVPGSSKRREGKKNIAFESDEAKKAGDKDTNGKPSPTTVSTDAGSTVSSASPSVSKSLNQPTETTPLRHRKEDSVQQQSGESCPSSRPISSSMSNHTLPTTPRPEKKGSDTPSLTPSTQIPQAPRSLPAQVDSQPENKPVSSGYGWISSKPKVDAK